MNIRDFTPDDYPGLVAIQNAVYLDTPAVVEDWIEVDEKRDPKCQHRRWVGEEGGRIVGMAQYDQDLWQYHPQHFDLMVRVHPDFQGRGFGKALYATVIAALDEFEPAQLTAGLREDHPYARQWAEKLGFAFFIRDQRSALTPSEFDPAQFADAERRAAAAGITVKSYLELADDPDRDRKLYQLDMETVPDVPGMDDFTEPGFEAWLKDVILAPTQPKEAYLVAVTTEGEYVGLTMLWTDRASDMLFTGLTAVKRAYRRKGVATALKVRALRWAQAHGCSRVNTDNAETNPMLQLNYRLGFRPLPAYLGFKKTLRETTPEADAAAQPESA